MPVIPSSVTEPIWVEFAALIPPREKTHPLGYHWLRIADRVAFDKLIQTLGFGAAHQRIADHTCSAPSIRNRRDEWIEAGIVDALEQAHLESNDRKIDLDLSNLAVDGCTVKAPCGDEAAAPSPVGRGKQRTNRSLLIECDRTIPLGCVIAGANRNDSPLLPPTLEKLARFALNLPDQITTRLNTGYNFGRPHQLLETFGCDHEISTRGVPLQIRQRSSVERPDPWHNRGFPYLQVRPNDEPA